MIALLSPCRVQVFSLTYYHFSLCLYYLIIYLKCSQLFILKLNDEIETSLCLQLGGLKPQHFSGSLTEELYSLVGHDLQEKGNSLNLLPLESVNIL